MSALLLTPAVQAQSVPPAHDPQQGAPDRHAAGVDMRGDHAMGFSHETTAHHFILLSDGGIIAVEARRDQDDETRTEIRSHLTHIAAMFGSNDFDIPMFIHDKVPPGVPVMKQKRDSITYTYKMTGRGGQVRIKTADPDAVKAVHEFLVFQMRDHRTGDPEQVQADSSNH